MQYGFFGFSPVESAMFSILPILVGLGFLVVIGLIAVTLVRGIGQWNRNNHSPVLTVEAEVVTKRLDVRYRQQNQGTGSAAGVGTSHTTYFATFQVESGDRLELAVPDREYGLLVEGDKGKLTFQGTRYQGFQRR